LKEKNNGAQQNRAVLRKQPARSVTRRDDLIVEGNPLD
jgi:hypothetical protein